MKVRWTDQAFQLLVEIEAFIARDDPEAGERLVDRFIASSPAARRLPTIPS